MIFVNFKSAYGAIGDDAAALAEKIEAIRKKTKVEIILVPHYFDVYPCRVLWKGLIWVQHADLEYGATGKTSIEGVVDEGLQISGTFLNHSENKYPSLDKLSKAVSDCKIYGLQSLVFAADEKELDQVLTFKPDFVAYEPPELIASPTTSVAKSRPDQIAKAARASKTAGVPLLVGAGVKEAEDVRLSLKLGAVGVVVSSAVISAKNPGQKLLELASGFKQDETI